MGGIDRQPSTLGKSFYPPPPNLLLNPLDDPAMASFSVLNWHPLYGHARLVAPESDIWKLTAFLTA